MPALTFKQLRKIDMYTGGESLVLGFFMRKAKRAERKHRTRSRILRKGRVLGY